MSNTTESIVWDDVIKKEARGAIDDSDFGEVQEVGQQYVLTQRDMVSKEKFYIPKYLVQGFDGDTLWFNASENDLQGWKRDSPPDNNEYSNYKTQETPSDVETRIPLIEERLNVSKSTSTSEATIIKEPVTETKTIEVSVMHEEIVIEKRSATAAEGNASTLENPPSKTTRTLIRVPLIHEVVKIKKEPYVRQEIVIRKKPRTETKTISDFVISEKVDTSSNNNTIGQTS
jgi:uncharacterized protein (TIGR02271 family)